MENRLEETKAKVGSAVVTFGCLFVVSRVLLTC